MLLPLLQSLIFIPLTVSSVGLNYTFVLIAMWLVLRRRRIRIFRNPLLLATFTTFTLLYFIALSFQLAFNIHLFDPVRSSISFLLFLSIFTLPLAPFSKQDLLCLLESLILFSAGYSVFTILSYLFYATSLGGGFDFELIKTLVGSQRTGFLLVFSLFYVLQSPHEYTPSYLNRQPIKALIIILILSGILLTFSRASFLAMAFGGLVMLVQILSRTLHLPPLVRKRDILISLRYIIITLSLCGFIIYLFQAPLGFMIAKFAELGESTVSSTSLGSVETRFLIINTALNISGLNFLIGNAFQGISALPELHIGSSHNQYLDVFFRSGLLGLSIYVTLLAYLGLVLHRKAPFLLPGYLAIILYGCFHETFKEPQGAALLSILLCFCVGRYLRYSTPNSGTLKRETS